MASTRLAKLLIDTVDRFAGVSNDAERWTAMADTAAHIGANAISTAAFRVSDFQMLWARSSTASEWIEEYITDDLVTADPSAHALENGTLPFIFQLGDDLPGQRPHKRRAQVHAGNMRYSYNYFCSHVWTADGVTQIVQLSTESDPTHLFGRGTAQALRTVSAILAENCTPPEHTPLIPPARHNGLSPRERDVLCLLAHGYTNADIADRLGLSEPTVTHVLTQAGRKVGAVSREQLLAIAVARGLLDL